MKKGISLVLVLVMCVSLCACGKSKAAKECEELIAAIGEVSVDSKDAIEAAERSYSALTAEEKDSISKSAVIMNDAIDAYYMECCKLIFGTLNDAHEIVSSFGDDLYALGNATKNNFDFGSERLNFLKYLVDKVSIHLTEEELRQGIESTVEGHNLLDGYDADLCLFVTHTRSKYGRNELAELCLKGVSNAYKLTNRVTATRDALYAANVMMAEVEGKESCAKYSVILKNYYDAIEEYLEICLDIDDAGQIDQFNTMRDSYLGYTTTYISDLEAMFTK